MNYKFKVILLFAAVILSVLLISCRDVSENGINTTYGVEYIALPDNVEVNFMLPLQKIGERVYIPCYVESNSSGIADAVYSVDADGKNGALETELSAQQASDVITYLSVSHADGTVSVQIFNGERASLVYSDGDNKKQFELDIGDIFGIDVYSALNGLYNGKSEFICGLISDGKDIFIALGREIAVISENGSVRGTIKTGAKIISLNAVDSGTITASCVLNNKTVVYPLDKSAMKIGESVALPDKFAGKNVELYIGKGYEIYVKADDGLYGYNSGEKPILIIDWLASGILYSEIKSIAVISPEKFIISSTDFDGGNGDFNGIAAVLTPSDGGGVKKTELTCAYTDARLYYSLSRDVLNFNKSSDKYCVKLLDYAQYNSDSDNTRGWTLLSVDIAADRCPDLIVLSSEIPAESLISKGVLYDLNVLGNYSEKLLGCLTSDGRLYSIPTDFDITGYVGKADNFPSIVKWDVETAFEYIKGIGDGERLINLYCGYTIFNYLMKNGIEEFADFDAGVCYFESGLFIEILDYVKNQLPTREEATLIHSSSENSDLRDDKLLLKAVSLNGLLSCKTLCDSFNVSDISELVIIGFPNSGGKSTVVNVRTAFAATVKCDASGAAEFLSYLISDKRYESGDYLIPAAKSAFDAMLNSQSGDFGFIVTVNMPAAIITPNVCLAMAMLKSIRPKPNVIFMRTI